MNATTVLMSIIQWVLLQKFGVVILIALAVVFGFSIIRNIIAGSFNVSKFAGGFNLFAGGVQGKLIYYAVFAILAFGLYHQLTRATTSYDTDYKNNIHNNQDVIVDQRVGNNTGCNVELVFGLVKIGCKQESVKKIVNNATETKVINQTTQSATIKETAIKNTSVFKKVWSFIVKPINAIKKAKSKK